MSEKIPVLIVGAGPSGLTMAAALHHHGIDCRIIEKREKPTQTSNAVGMHARTLEMLDDMNIVEPFVKRGQRIDFLRINQGRKNLAQIPTAQIESYYNYLLSIPQNISENILNHHLNKIKKPVERNLTLTDIVQTRQSIVATVINPQQETEEIHCDYLIACDGAHSTVRELRNMTFSGIDIKQQFILADVHIPHDFPDNAFTVYFHPEGPFAVIPFEKGHARVVATLINADRDPAQPVSLLEIQQLAEKRSYNQFSIKDTNWMSSFWIHSKMLNTFHQGNIFFVGDAAHIHSPVGAQGMNTGMQDAYNLAWKLALTMKHQAKPMLLESYNDERQANAIKLLANTEHMTAMVLAKNPLTQWVRQTAIKYFLKRKIVQHAFITEISMLSVHYEKSPIINYEFHVSSKGPLSGHRAPDVIFTDRDGPKRLDELLRTTKHTLLLFTGAHAHDSDIAKLREVEEWAVKHEELINPIIIVHPNFADQFSDQCPLDTYHDLHEAYHADKPCFFMIRPDNYIGCCSVDLDITLLIKYWISIF